MKKKITKKEFKEKVRFDLYSSSSCTSKTNVFFYDWKSDFSNNKRIVGYKYAVAALRTHISKAKLLDQLYDWVVNEKQPDYYVRYKFASTDEQRFKVPLSLNF